MLKTVALKSFTDRSGRRTASAPTGLTAGNGLRPYSGLRDLRRPTVGRNKRGVSGGCGWMLAASLLLGALAQATPSLLLAQQSRPENQLMLDLLNRIERLEAEVRRLRGDLDTVQYNQENVLRRVESLEQNDGEETTEAEQPSAAPPPTPPAAAVTAPPALPPGAASQPNTQPRVTAPGAAFSAPPTAPQPGAAPTAAEQEAYNSALNLLRQERYRDAIPSLQDFMAVHPGSPLNADAQYWIGEAYYINREYESAKQAFLALGINYPTSRRLPDAMLRLGYIYADQNDRSKAVDVLQKLIESYPDSKAAGLARQRLQTLR